MTNRNEDFYLQPPTISWRELVLIVAFSLLSASVIVLAMVFKFIM